MIFPVPEGLSVEELKAYRDGYLNALKTYAIWNNGTEFVGCGVRTLKEAEDEIIEHIYQLTADHGKALPSTDEPKEENE